MSAHKHHEYTVRDNDHDNSKYTKYGCNDDLNGRGARILLNLKSLERRGGYYNNVGELRFHSSSPFVNELGPYYRGQSAWGKKGFYKCGSNRGKWMTHAIIK